MAREDPELAALGAFIRDRRKALNLTQAQLAERLGWTQERISVLEHGKYGVPSLPALVRLGDALEAPVLALVEALGYPEAGSMILDSSTRTDHTNVALHYTLERLLAINALTLKDALDQASDQMSVAMGADKIDAFVYDAPTDSLVALGSSNTPMARLQHQSGLSRLPLANRERTTQVYQTRESFYTGDARNDPFISVGAKETLGVQSLLAVPLCVDSRVLGVMVAESATSERFSEEEQRFFLAASQWVATIAHRADLIDRMQKRLMEEARREAADGVITALANDLGRHLTPLRGKINLLCRTLEKTGQEREVEHVREAARSIAEIEQLVNRLLSASRLDRGLLAFSLQPIDLSRLVQDSAEEMRATWPNLVVRAGDLPQMEGDPARLQEVLVSLVRSAIDRSPLGAPITLGANVERRDDGPWAVIDVSDEGTGNSEDGVPGLFGHSSGECPSADLDTGLYLYRRLVETHGGTLTAHSALGKGTTLRVALPLQEV